MSVNKPYVIEIKDIPDIFNSKNDLVLSLYLAQPLISLGFHTYIHQNKNKLNYFLPIVTPPSSIDHPAQRFQQRKVYGGRGFDLAQKTSSPM